MVDGQQPRGAAHAPPSLTLPHAKWLGLTRLTLAFNSDVGKAANKRRPALRKWRPNHARCLNVCGGGCFQVVSVCERPTVKRDLAPRLQKAVRFCDKGMGLCAPTRFFMRIFCTMAYHGTDLFWSMAPL